MWVLCIFTWAEIIRAGIDEINKSGAAVEFGKEESSVGLGFRGFDPLKARPESAVTTATFAKDSAAIATHSHDILDREREKMEMKKKKGKGGVMVFYRWRGIHAMKVYSVV